jgi:dCTP diphosphatase
MSKRKHDQTTSSTSSSTSSSTTTVATIPDGHHTIRQTTFDTTKTLEHLRTTLAQFANERDWDQFHSPRNLVLAMMGEVGEIAECFQWKGDEKCQNNLEGWKNEKLIHLGEELSDVLLYLVRLADRCNIDLAAAAARKLVINGLKYPAAAVKGRSEKYDTYKTEWRAQEASKKAKKNVVVEEEEEAEKEKEKEKEKDDGKEVQ